MEYNAFLYEKESIERINGSLENLLDKVLLDINSPIRNLEIITEEERKQLLLDFNRTNAPYPEEKTIHGWFAEQVEKTTHHIAVSSPVELNDIYDLLETAAVNPDLEQKMKTLCFSRNPYIYRSRLE